MMLHRSKKGVCLVLPAVVARSDSLPSVREDVVMARQIVFPEHEREVVAGRAGDADPVEEGKVSSGTASARYMLNGYVPSLEASARRRDLLPFLVFIASEAATAAHKKRQPLDPALPDGLKGLFLQDKDGDPNTGMDGNSLPSGVQLTH